jgi:hypothetical protein
MSLAALGEWVQSLPLFTAIRESAYVYPTLLATHLASIGVFGGLILMTDLRLLGLALEDYPAAALIDDLRWWKRAGFVIMVTCGALIAGSKAGEYLLNPYFLLKLSLLGLVGAHAVAFRRAVYGGSLTLDGGGRLPAAARIAGAC